MTWFRSTMVIVFSALAVVAVVLAAGRGVREAAVFGVLVTALVAAYLIRARAGVYRDHRAGGE
jgi:hypothetical protein